MLRTRDVFALIAAFILVRLAWNNGSDTISAAVDLAFFFPRERVMAVTPMDVDGDGSKEALAIVKAVENTESFQISILDLKQLALFQKTYLEPFRPKTIFTSETIYDDNAHPIHVTTGQLLLKKHGSPIENPKDAVEKPKSFNDHEINDRTRHYFCGNDWHDASSGCKTPCPGGLATECPDGEQCYADTPCDILDQGFMEETTNADNKIFELTPGGGMPSVVSLWSNGVLILHSLTSMKSDNEDSITKKRNKKTLELKEMWRYRIFPAEKSEEMLDMLWEEINVVFLDAYTTTETKATNGMVVVSASYFLDGDPESDRSTFTVAVDAFKGTLLWESHSDVGLDTDAKPLPLPIVDRGQTSFARRRSSIARVMQGTQTGASASALPNCMSLLKKAIKKEVLPYSYWGPKDAGVAAIHLSRKNQSKDGQNHKASKPHEEHGIASQNNHPHPRKKKWHHKFHRRKNSIQHKHGPIQGKPNALVMQTRGGLQIRSLKNGKALCHLALLEESLYSDLNNDGVLDQVQVALHTKTHKPDDRFIWKLAARLHEEQEELQENGASKQELRESQTQLCHLLALSGIPAKEEIFSAPVCGKAHDRVGLKPGTILDAVNPLVVESLDRKGDKHDVVVALNNGMVHRIHGSKGKRMWATSGTQHSTNFPTWEEQNNRVALLTRLQSKQVPLPVRPLILAGENSLAVLSVKTGALLASAPFPQASESKPILADVSGDGSTDVIILTRDGIWGYQIIIHPASPVAQRLLVGLLLMILMLATIRNRYSKGGKRSTDP